MAALAGLLALAALQAGCSRQSTLEPESEPARQIADLWWWMLGASIVVFAGTVVLLMIAWVRRGRPGLPLLGEREGASTGLVLLFGMVLPVVALVVLFAIANLGVMKTTEAPRASTTAMSIEVIGHQWFWEIRYPGTAAVTANEIHIPARTRVNVIARTADVIHSLWVPQLNRKIDMVPGHPNRILFYANRPGRYRGQCAEFCGLQHAHMALYVFADPPSAFRAWLANMARSRPSAASPAAAASGERVFLSNACASCHTIRGTSARGEIGPDLTHLATRTTLAAVTIPNHRGDLDRWVRRPQEVKPGNRMPALNLSRTDYRALVAYLETLR
ncbi:MAG: c-type cytochrome [Solirubrobacteraceae bacterium]